LEGSLELKGSLSIGPNGKVNANIKATEIIVSGTVKGNMEASERIVLRKGAHLVGDVKTSGIVIEDGAYFKGGIDIAQPKALSATATAGSSK
jgi:cytoskeletal protein CcmA (bactofilin family)